MRIALAVGGGIAAGFVIFVAAFDLWMIFGSAPHTESIFPF